VSHGEKSDLQELMKSQKHQQYSWSFLFKTSVACSQFYNYVKTNPSMLAAVKKSEKYDWYEKRSK
jgi:hypothetical protein